ncbi:MAG TPA: heparinase II/III family protein, partial [Blastocatellia bacterium]|nr:heparinase II/III family protein [Blastocatellia bacterium]
NVRPRVNSWESTRERDVLDAEHYAYQRLAEPVTHRRIVTFNKSEGYWTVEDIFTGQAQHQFEFFFNFDAGLDVALDGRNCATASDASVTLTIVPVSDHKLEAHIEERWVSPAYGTRLNSSAIIYSLAAEVPLKVTFELRPVKRKLNG